MISSIFRWWPFQDKRTGSECVPESAQDLNTEVGISSVNSDDFIVIGSSDRDLIRDRQGIWKDISTYDTSSVHYLHTDHNKFLLLPKKPKKIKTASIPFKIVDLNAHRTQLGSGVTAIVFSLERLDVRCKSLAFKLLKSNCGDSGQQLIAAQREVEKANNLRLCVDDDHRKRFGLPLHCSVIRDGDEIYIVMRRVDGDGFDFRKSLSQMAIKNLKIQKQWYYAQHASMAVQFLNAIYIARQNQEIPLDLKLDNIFYQRYPDGRLKMFLGDLGGYKSEEEVVEELHHRIFKITFSPGYMSTEIFAKINENYLNICPSEYLNTFKELSNFSAGVCLYTGITGKMPFELDKKNLCIVDPSRKYSRNLTFIEFGMYHARLKEIIERLMDTPAIDLTEEDLKIGI